jgi:hypothetical protein
MIVSYLMALGNAMMKFFRNIAGYKLRRPK